VAHQRAALVLGLGNLLWADEGFGVRAVEALNAAWRFPDGVDLIDGGTQGMGLLELVCTSPRVLILDCADLRAAPGTLRVLRDGEIAAWSATKLSPHQTGFNDVLAAAALKGEYPERLTVVGVQPAVLDDFGGTLSELVRARLAPAVDCAAAELAAWGLAGTPRAAGELVPALNAGALAIDAYEAQRPAADAACRTGDERFLAIRAAQET
jgi:hydrogenase maturation protease